METLLTSVYPCTPGQVDEQADEEEMYVLSKPGEVTFHCFLLTTSNSFFLHPMIPSRVAILPVSNNKHTANRMSCLKTHGSLQTGASVEVHLAKTNCSKHVCVR